MDPPPTASFPTVRVSAADSLPRRTPFSPNGRESRTQRTQHYSTTPKTAPNREYYDFIRKGGITLLDLESAPGPADTLASRDSDDNRYGKISLEDLSTLGEHEQQEERGQSQDTPSDNLDRIPVSSNIMAFARKSIMQHATTQPRSIFSRLNEKKLQSAKPASLASAQPSPAATTNSSKSRGAGLEKPTLKSTVPSSVSRPKMSPTAFAVATTSSTPPTRAGPVLTPATIPTVPKPSIPARSVLDFSGASGSGPVKKNLFSFDPSTSKIAPPSSIVGATMQRPVVIAPPSLATGTKMDDIQSEYTKEPSLASTGKDPSNHNGFDLRALLRQDSARVQYRLPTLVASLSPPASPKRPSPYDIPSLKEREALRARRMPRFKARPLNPKVFTSAGDLGVPRIPKQPLTVPKSPVFSRTRVRRDMLSTTGQTTGTITPRTTTASRLQSVLSEGVKRSRMEDAANKETHPAQTSSSAGVKRDRTTQSSSMSWSGQLSVPAVDQVRLVPKPSATPSVSSVVRNTPLSFPPSHLRRPNSTRPALTNPKPFKFATTELQRKRMKAANSNALTLEDLA